MTDAITCGSCGADVEAGALFCSRCGMDVTAPPGTDATRRDTTTGGSPTVPVRAEMRQALREATLGEYEILSEIGRGGMATVFLAHDISLDRKVAIKVMAPHLLEGEGMVERFRLEARTAAQLSHPHIIPIYAVKESEETLYFVMKFVEGRGLDEILKKSTSSLTIPVVTDILKKVGAALGYAHRRGVVHRDVKPANIMIDEEGTPVVTDFGIAKVERSQSLTLAGSTIGTPTYMSPEQCEAQDVTGASDQYSLAMVAFEMLTGRPPFKGSSPMMTMYKHVHEDLPPLADFRPDCPPELVETIERMAAKDPEDRWPSLEAMIQKLATLGTDPSLDPVRGQLIGLVKGSPAAGALEHLTTVPSAALPPPTAAPTPAAAPRGRSRLVAGFAAVAVIGAGALAVLQPWSSGPPAPVGEPPPASPAPVSTTPPPSEPQAAGTEPAVAAGDQSPEPEPGAAPADPVAAATEPAPQEPDAAGAEPAPPAAPPTVAVIRIGGVPDRIAPGETVGLTATAQSSSGSAVPGARPQWRSSDEAVARVGSGGQLTAVGPGQVVVTASVGGVSGSATLTVAEIAVASVVVGPSSLALEAGGQATLTAEVRAGSGAALSGRAVAWSSDDEAVARVSQAGEVVALGPGRATITATSEGVSATAVVAVTLPTADAITRLVSEYARALESRDIEAVRRAYPGMTAEQQLQLGQALPLMENLRAELAVRSIDDQGDVATAAVSGTYRFEANGRPTETPVSFTATFRRGASGWSMTETR